jgi:hypothetical protein
MNKGLELLVNETSLSISSPVSMPSSYKRLLITAPTGNPDVKPMATTSELHPGRPKTGLMIGSNRMPRKRTNPRLIKSSATMKKGNKAGRMVKAHNINASLAAPMVCAGLDTIKKAIISIIVL